MTAELYQWIKNLAVFYIVFTAVLQLIPDKKYETYVRSFLGLILVLLLCTSLFSMAGKGQELLESFGTSYQEEKAALKEEEERRLNDALSTVDRIRNAMDEVETATDDGTAVDRDASAGDTDGLAGNSTVR
jgi:hypothetical protein